MIIIDTDHATFFKYPDSERGRRFIDRLSAVPSSEVIGTSIVTVEERMRGWLATIAKERTSARQVLAYRELAQLFEFYQQFEIVPFDESAAAKFDELRSLRIKVGARDLKIAATALVHRAVLLTANLSDFKKVPDLQAENWLD